jgi:hypothetical protein
VSGSSEFAWNQPARRSSENSARAMAGSFAGVRPHNARAHTRVVVAKLGVPDYSVSASEA